MKTAIVGLIFGAVFAFPAAAQQSDHAAAGTHAAQPPAAVAGEVRKIDKAAKKITLKHGPIPNLDMPAMTMAFFVQKASLLDHVRVGDKVMFNAERIGEHITVTRIERSAK